MFARGTPCLNGRRLSTFLDGVVLPSDEPLLFLYPRWFTRAMRQKTSALKINNVEACVKFPKPRSRLHRRLLPCSPLVNAVSKRWLSATIPLENNGTAPADYSSADYLPGSPQSNNPETRANRTRCEDQGHYVTTGIACVEKIPESTNDIPSRPVIRAAPRVDSISGVPQIQRVQRTRKRPLIFDPRRKEAHRLGSGDKALPLAKRLSGRELMKLRYRRHIVLWQRSNRTRVPSVHWTNILSLLERLSRDNFPWPKSTKHRVIHIPEETVALLSGSVEMEENMWYMFILNGCRIRVVEATESEGSCRKVILSGTERATGLAEQAILRLSSRQAKGDPSINLKKPPVPIIPSITAMQSRSLPVPIIRGVWRESTLGHHRMLLEEIPTPSVLSVRRFAEYVNDLVKSHGDAQRHEGSSAQPTRTEQIKDIIELLFSREANQKFVSTSALNRALSFLCSHEFLRSARLVLSKAEAVASANTYNILLLCAAKRQDLWVFQHILSSMSRFHVRPNRHTWIAFLHCLISQSVREKVMHHMLDKGYMADQKTVETILKLSISSMFSRHLDSGRDVQSFIRSVIKNYSHKFLSPLSLNLMLEEAVVRKDFDAMKQIVECFNQFQLSIDSRTLNQVLRFFRADIHKALWFLFRYIRLDRYPFDESNFEKLFLTASKNRSFNLCRVLWRYACMEGLTSWKMRQTVKMSLECDVSRSEGDNVGDVWQRSAGKVIVGLKYHQTEIESPETVQGMVASEYEDDPIALLATPTSSLEMRDVRRAVARELVRRDVQEAKHFQPVEPLVMMLDAASLLDRRWKELSLSTGEMVQNAIHVPIRKKTRSPYCNHFNRIPLRSNQP